MTFSNLDENLNEVIHFYGTVEDAIHEMIFRRGRMGEAHFRQVAGEVVYSLALQHEMLYLGQGELDDLLDDLMEVHNGTRISLCSTVRNLRAAVSGLFRGEQFRRAGLLLCWRVLEGELLRMKESGGLDESGLERLELLMRLLEDAGAAGSGGSIARAALDLALRGSVGGLLAELRPPRCQPARRPGAGADSGGEEAEARIELSRLEVALLAGLAGAPPGSARLDAVTTLEKHRYFDGSLLMRGADDLPVDLWSSRGWLTALSAGLEDLLRGRLVEEERREERARGAADRSVPALPLALLQAGEDLLMLPRRVVPVGDLAALTRDAGAGFLQPGELAICWLAGAGSAAAYAAPAVTEEVLRAGGAALAGCAGDLLLRLVVRSAAAEAAAGRSPALLSWRGGLSGLAVALAGEEPGTDTVRRGGRDLRPLHAGLEMGQHLRIRLRGGRWIGGLWTWRLSGGGRGGSLLELRPESILLPGAREEGALLPVLAAPALPVETAHRAAGLRFQWRLLVLLRQARVEELRAGEGAAPGLPDLPDERLLAEARELDLPGAAALALLNCWRGAGGWLRAAPGGRLALVDRDAARLLEEGARLALRSARVYPPPRR